MADFLDEKKREIADRLNELRPLVAEFERLEAAQHALDDGGSSGAPVRRRSRGASSSTRARRRGRPRGQGTRAKQALDIVRKQPGVTISEIADRMGIKQNYLYRVLPTLEQEGQARKEGRGWHPV